MPKNKKVETFLINITVLEGRHYAISTMDSYVQVRVDNHTKSTKIRYQTDCPYYNEYFVFEFVTDLQTLLDKNITLSVLKQRSMWKMKKTLGYCTLDIATVWEQPEHQFFRKWAILSSIRSDFTGPKGYLKVTISIQSKGDTPKIPLYDPEEDDVIEGNLLLPEGLTLERQRAQFIFNIYKGMDLFKHKQLLKPAHGKIQKKDLPNVFIQITFAGLKARTKVVKHTASPQWNESLTIAELYPPLCQRIKIDLFSNNNNIHNTLEASKYLNLHSISSDKEFGFLPIFGPTFVHFYTKVSNGHVYAGKILMSLETKTFFETHTRTRCVIKDTISPMIESKLWRYEKVIIFAVILNVSVIEKKYSGKPISFELQFGSVNNDSMANFNETIHNSLYEITAHSVKVEKFAPIEQFKKARRKFSFKKSKSIGDEKVKKRKQKSSKAGSVADSKKSVIDKKAERLERKKMKQMKLLEKRSKSKSSKETKRAKRTFKALTKKTKSEKSSTRRADKVKSISDKFHHKKKSPTSDESSGKKQKNKIKKVSKKIKEKKSTTSDAKSVKKQKDKIKKESKKMKEKKSTTSGKSHKDKTKKVSKKIKEKKSTTSGKSHKDKIKKEPKKIKEKKSTTSGKSHKDKIKKVPKKKKEKKSSKSDAQSGKIYKDKIKKIFTKNNEKKTHDKKSGTIKKEKKSKSKKKLIVKSKKSSNENKGRFRKILKKSKSKSKKGSIKSILKKNKGKGDGDGKRVKKAKKKKSNPDKNAVKSWLSSEVQVFEIIEAKLEQVMNKEGKPKPKIEYSKLLQRVRKTKPISSDCEGYCRKLQRREILLNKFRRSPNKSRKGGTHFWNLRKSKSVPLKVDESSDEAEQSNDKPKKPNLYSRLINKQPKLNSPSITTNSSGDAPSQAKWSLFKNRRHKSPETIEDSPSSNDQRKNKKKNVKLGHLDPFRALFGLGKPESSTSLSSKSSEKDSKRSKETNLDNKSQRFVIFGNRKKKDESRNILCENCIESSSEDENYENSSNLQKIGIKKVRSINFRNLKIKDFKKTGEKKTSDYYFVQRPKLHKFGEQDTQQWFSVRDDLFANEEYSNYYLSCAKFPKKPFQHLIPNTESVEELYKPESSLKLNVLSTSKLSKRRKNQITKNKNKPSKEKIAKSTKSKKTTKDNKKNEKCNKCMVTRTAKNNNKNYPNPPDLKSTKNTKSTKKKSAKDTKKKSPNESDEKSTKSSKNKSSKVNTKKVTIKSNKKDGKGKIYKPKHLIVNYMHNITAWPVLTHEFFNYVTKSDGSHIKSNSSFSNLEQQINPSQLNSGTSTDISKNNFQLPNMYPLAIGSKEKRPTNLSILSRTSTETDSCYKVENDLTSFERSSEKQTSPSEFSQITGILKKPGFALKKTGPQPIKRFRFLKQLSFHLKPKKANIEDESTIPTNIESLDKLNYNFDSYINLNGPIETTNHGQSTDSSTPLSIESIIPTQFDEATPQSTILNKIVNLEKINEDLKSFLKLKDRSSIETINRGQSTDSSTPLSIESIIPTKFIKYNEATRKIRNVEELLSVTSFNTQSDDLVKTNVDERTSLTELIETSDAQTDEIKNPCMTSQTLQMPCCDAKTGSIPCKTNQTNTNLMPWKSKQKRTSRMSNTKAQTNKKRKYDVQSSADEKSSSIQSQTLATSKGNVKSQISPNDTSLKIQTSPTDTKSLNTQTIQPKQAHVRSQSTPKTKTNTWASLKSQILPNNTGTSLKSQTSPIDATSLKTQTSPTSRAHVKSDNNPTTWAKVKSQISPISFNLQPSPPSDGINYNLQIPKEIPLAASQSGSDVIEDNAPKMNYKKYTNISREYKPVSKDHQFWNVKFGDKVPCLYKQALYPDLRRRLYNSNLISTITANMKSYLIELERLFISDEFVSRSHLIEQKLVDMLDYVGSACRKFIDIVKPTAQICVTNLDREKMQFCIREMADIEELCRHLYEPRFKKKTFRKAEKICRRLEILVDHPQECWPDVFLWMNCGNKKAVNMRFQAQQLVHSLVEDEKGEYCGKVQNMFFRANKKTFSDIACKIELFLWMGLERQKDEFYKAIPKGYSIPRLLTEDEFPSYLLLNNVIRFQCRAHLYQGRFGFAKDNTGLSDLFVKVIIGDEVRTSQVCKATLNPIWDQTLHFQEILAFGTQEQIAKNPPVVVLQIADKDNCCQSEYLGMCTINPVIKFKEMPYVRPNFPPKLTWHQVKNNLIVQGEILAAIELLEIDETEPQTMHREFRVMPIVTIPDDIKPVLVEYRMEVMFWGLRELKKIQHIYIQKPQIIIECVDTRMYSEVLTNSKDFSNFTEPYRFIQLMLPNKEEYVSPLSIKMFDFRSFGRYTYAGTNLSYIQQFIYHPITKYEWDRRLQGIGLKSKDSLESKPDSDEIKIKIMKRKQQTAVTIDNMEDTKRKKCTCQMCCLWFVNLFKKQEKPVDISLPVDPRPPIIEDCLDWWSKYYSSIEDTVKKAYEAEIIAQIPITQPMKKKRKKKLKDDDIIMDEEDEVIKNKNFKLIIYDNELEKQKEFDNFNDTLSTFKIYKGKTIGDDAIDDYHQMGVLKGKIVLYRWPPEDNVEYVSPTGKLLKDGYFQGYPVNEKQSYMLRVYCVRGIKLRPKDLRGKSDAYIRILMNGKLLANDSKNYVAKNVNPIFGRSFEFLCMLPDDSRMTIQVWDWDKATNDDLIGETVIDIENRLYTQYRAACGIQFEYTQYGSCPWRDRFKPTQILELLCDRFDLQPAQFQEDSILVGNTKFQPDNLEDSIEDRVVYTTYEQATQFEWKKEMMALYVLHNWQRMPGIGYRLVPEHVETRSLYHPNKPGIEQGKLHMWVDIFPLSNDVPPPMAVKIVPRKPLKYELRVTIWNVEDVLMKDDDFFTGDRKSDIYVKGWLSRQDILQKTDVHYRSMTGEGNFNWRFVFPFEYLSTENKVVVHKKETIFDIDETERKIPCKLKLQVWDNDVFTKDDFIGTLTLELNKIPRGAKLTKLCTKKILERSAPTVNLFKIRRTRAWWPFVCMNKGKHEYEQTGKLDAELELVTGEEAETDPVGLGRADPHALPNPNRPDLSFAWFRNPLKTIKFILWKGMKGNIIKFFVFLLIILFVVVILYTFPREIGVSLYKSLQATWQGAWKLVKRLFVYLYRLITKTGPANLN